MNYHNLVSSFRFGQCENMQFKCGSATDLNKQFCHSNSTICPFNQMDVNRWTNASGNSSKFAQNWTISYSKSNNLNNPIVDLYIGISRPCGFRNQQYINRSVPVRSYYDVSDDLCDYNDQGSKEHSLYYPLSFS